MDSQPMAVLPAMMPSPEGKSAPVDLGEEHWIFLVFQNAGLAEDQSGGTTHEARGQSLENRLPISLRASSRPVCAPALKPRS